MARVHNTTIYKYIKKQGIFNYRVGTIVDRKKILEWCTTINHSYTEHAISKREMHSRDIKFHTT